jgi:type IV pilus assembly protein PilV
MNTTSPRSAQQGMSLLEGLLAVLIFSVGILALVALQGTSVRATTEAKMRADASFHASQLIARMWTDALNLTNYSYNTGNPGDPNCAFAPGGGNHAAVVKWAGDVQAALPGATAQVIITNDALVTNLIAITICWPSGTETRRFQTVTQINF